MSTLAPVPGFPSARWRALLRRTLPGALCLLLGACASAPRQALAHAPPRHSSRAMLPGPGSAVPPDLPQKGGYYLDDGPGDGPPVDPSAVPDAVPRDEAPLANANRPYEALGEVYFPDTSSLPFSERGVASWYGRRFHGRRTSSGESYDMYAMTGAHKTLPIPSYARVTDLATGKSVVVRINDRGPFHPGRVIDLSFTAAAKLGYVDRGSSEVLVERVFPAGFSDLPDSAQASTTVAVHETVVSARNPARLPLAMPSSELVTPVGAPPGVAQPNFGSDAAARAANAWLPAHPATAGDGGASGFVDADGSGSLGAASSAGVSAAGATSATAASGGAPGASATASAAGAIPGASAGAAAHSSGGPGSAALAAASAAGARIASAGRGLFLQLGAFRDAANARRLLEQARGALHGLEAFLSLEVEGGLSRVRLGPFPSPKEQNAAAGSVERLLHVRPGLVGP